MLDLSYCLLWLDISTCFEQVFFNYFFELFLSLTIFSYIAYLFTLSLCFVKWNKFMLMLLFLYFQLIFWWFWDYLFLDFIRNILDVFDKVCFEGSFVFKVKIWRALLTRVRLLLLVVFIRKIFVKLIFLLTWLRRKMIVNYIVDIVVDTVVDNCYFIPTLFLPRLSF